MEGSSGKRARTSSLLNAFSAVVTRRRCHADARDRKSGKTAPALAAPQDDNADNADECALSPRSSGAAQPREQPGGASPSAASLASSASWPSSARAELDSADAEEEEEACFICLGAFTARHRRTAIPCANKCSQHTVHTRCIYEWQECKAQQAGAGAGSCPLCRGPLAPLQYLPRDKIGSHLFRHDAAARREFIARPLPRRAGTVRCYVRALRRGPAQAPHRYELYLQAPTTLAYPLGPLPELGAPAPGDVLLAVSQRRSSQYSYTQLDISMDAAPADAVDLHAPGYLGCVYSSVQGLEHTLVAPCAPGAAHFSAPARQRAGTRSAANVCELGAVRYTQSRIDGAVAPRRIHVCFPAPARLAQPRLDTVAPAPRALPGAGKALSEGDDDDEDDLAADEDLDDEEEEEERAEQASAAAPNASRADKYRSRWVTAAHRPACDAELLSSKLAARAARDALGADQDERLVFGENKTPNWIEAISAFSLDFGGRVTLPSNKNFQLLVGAGAEQRLAMQFGKVGEAPDLELFTLDCAHPLSPLQAFGVALSACDRNLVSC